MIKQFLSIIISLCFSIGIYGQSIRMIEGELPKKRMSHRDTLDFSKIRVQYQVWFVKDTLYPEELREDKFVLQVGSRMSKSWNYFDLINDSISTEQHLAEKDFNEMLAESRGRPKGKLKFMQYKNYPEGKITTFDEVYLDRYMFEEDTPDFQWKLEAGKKTVLGYSCKKATLDFRGRTYEAWYAPEIPVSDGPWKFSGLPGLILKISDSRNHYDFEAIALYGVSWKDPIHLKSRNRIKTTRANFNKAMRRFVDDPGAVMLQSDKITHSPEMAATAKVTPYNPIELE